MSIPPRFAPPLNTTSSFEGLAPTDSPCSSNNSSRCPSPRSLNRFESPSSSTYPSPRNLPNPNQLTEAFSALRTDGLVVEPLPLSRNTSGPVPSPRDLKMVPPNASTNRKIKTAMMSHLSKVLPPTHMNKSPEESPRLPESPTTEASKSVYPSPNQDALLLLSGSRSIPIIRASSGPERAKPTPTTDALQFFLGDSPARSVPSSASGSVATTSKNSFFSILLGGYTKPPVSSDSQGTSNHNETPTGE